ncbi:MAG TPA: hypothetical protein VFA45_10510 [Actinomycetes bacterium]|nr:hypothetical protein [Actinomycetes bacterium]
MSVVKPQDEEPFSLINPLVALAIGRGRRELRGLP